MARRQPRCKVKFERRRGAVDAVLYFKGRSINYLAFPRGYQPLVSELRTAKKSLMDGCPELSRDNPYRERRR